MSDRCAFVTEVKRWDDEFTTSLKSFIAELTGLLESVPTQYRDATEIYFDHRGGDPEWRSGEIIITYSRVESDAEMAKRRTAELKRVADLKAWDEKRERDLFASLKRKYEP